MSKGIITRSYALMQARYAPKMYVEIDRSVFVKSVEEICLLRELRSEWRKANFITIKEAA